MLCNIDAPPIYPSVYREHNGATASPRDSDGLSLCIQGTRIDRILKKIDLRFIPVHTGNSIRYLAYSPRQPVYPCAYRELVKI